MPRRSPRLLPGTMLQHDFQGRLIFQHRNTAKWELFKTNPMVPGFRFEKECLAYLEELHARWDRVIHPVTPERSGPKIVKRRINGEADQQQTGMWTASRKRLATRLPLG